MTMPEDDAETLFRECNEEWRDAEVGAILALTQAVIDHRKATERRLREIDETLREMERYKPGS